MAELHGKSVVAYLDQFDVSSFLQTISTASNRDLADISAYGDNVHTFVAGLADGSMTLNGNYDGGAAATPDAIFGLRNGLPVIAMAAPRGDLVQGYRAFIHGGGGAVMTQYDVVSSITDANKFNAMVHGGGPFPAKFLEPRTGFTATGNGTALDNAALTSNGLVGQLHILANANASTVDFKIQHSVDSTTWVDLITFTQRAAGVLGAEQITVAGTVNRYLRVVRTFGGAGTVSAAVLVHRKVA